MRALALGGGLFGCAALLLGLPALAASAAVGVVVAVTGVLGAGLVTAPLPWLRGVAGVGAALLTLCLWLTLEGELSAKLLHPVAGALGVVGFAGALVVELRRQRAGRGRGGSQCSAAAPAPAPTPDVHPRFAADDTVERLRFAADDTVERPRFAADDTVERPIVVPRQRHRADSRPAAGSHRARPGARAGARRARRGSRIR